MTAVVQNIKRLINFADERMAPAMAGVFALVPELIVVIFAFMNGKLSSEFDFSISSNSFAQNEHVLLGR